MSDSANTLAQRDWAGNAQTFRIYNTFTDSSNYERGKLEWASNVLRIGTEKAGTGSARALELQTDGTTRLTIASTGNIGIGTGSTVDLLTVRAITAGTPQGITISGETSVRHATLTLSHDQRTAKIGLSRLSGDIISANAIYELVATNNDSICLVTNNANSHIRFLTGTAAEALRITNLGLLTFGGTTSSFPAIKRNAAALNFRLADDSADADITSAHGTFSAGTDTVSNPILNLSQTWNNAATTFTGILANVTDTASNASSLLMDLQVGGVSKFNVDKLGGWTVPASNTGAARRFYATSVALVCPGGIEISNGPRSGYWNWDSFTVRSDSFISFASSTSVPQGNGDVVLARDAAQTLAQRNAGNAQTFRVYNTFTDSSNYERGKLEWSSNVFRIGTEKAGTGSARALELQTDGTTRLTIDTSGKMLVNVASSFAHTHIKANSGAASLALEPETNFVSGVYFGGNSGDFTNSILRVSGGFDLQFTAGGALTFRTGSPVTERLSISATGLFTIADALNIAVGTTTGTKIGTATTQKLGFFNATPVVQPTAVADATDAASVITQLNALLSRMRTLGLIAT
jgi:hypothetical protein